MSQAVRNQAIPNHQSRLHLEMSPAPVDEVEKPASVYLVAHRPPLSKYPAIWRWLARLVYHRIGWCPDYGIEYQGVFATESEARFAASAPGYFYMELPLNASLPCETCQYGAHDFPHSEASADYRRRSFTFHAISTEHLKHLLLLEEKIDLLCANINCENRQSVE